MKGGPSMLTSSLFIIGLCLGSFVTCMAERISNGHILISTQRSRCPHCRHQLRFWQLIPLLGILLQRGQCYDCRTPISLRSSLIELLCGSLLASSSASLSLTLPLLIGYLVLISIVLLIISLLKSTRWHYFFQPDWAYGNNGHPWRSVSTSYLPY